jgi:COMPASS component SDC1
MSSSATPIGNHADSHNPATSVTGSLDTGLPTVAGGAPARLYMNEKIVPYLLEGMKNVARDQYVAIFHHLWY